MTDYEIYLAVICMWREARGQGDVGLRAILFVLRNRLREWRKACPDLYTVITQHAQFSSMTIAGDSNTTHYPAPAEVTAWFATAKKIFNGEDNDDPTKGALYYENPRIATSQWFTTNIVEQPLFHPHTATIGAHEFYK